MGLIVSVGPPLVVGSRSISRVKCQYLSLQRYKRHRWVIRGDGGLSRWRSRPACHMGGEHATAKSASGDARWQNSGAVGRRCFYGAVVGRVPGAEARTRTSSHRGCGGKARSRVPSAKSILVISRAFLTLCMRPPGNDSRSSTSSSKIKG